MVEVKWTPQAFQDLDSIVEFIAKDSQQYASVFVIDIMIMRAADRISAFPESGRIDEEGLFRANIGLNGRRP